MVEMNQAPWTMRVIQNTTKLMQRWVENQDTKADDRCEKKKRNPKPLTKNTSALPEEALCQFDPANPTSV